MDFSRLHKRFRLQEVEIPEKTFNVYLIQDAAVVVAVIISPYSFRNDKWPEINNKVLTYAKMMFCEPEFVANDHRWYSIMLYKKGTIVSIVMPSNSSNAELVSVAFALLNVKNLAFTKYQVEVIKQKDPNSKHDINAWQITDSKSASLLYATHGLLELARAIFIISDCSPESTNTTVNLPSYENNVESTNYAIYHYGL